MLKYKFKYLYYFIFHCRTLKVRKGHIVLYQSLEQHFSIMGSSHSVPNILRCEVLYRVSIKETDTFNAVLK